MTVDQRGPQLADTTVAPAGEGGQKIVLGPAVEVDEIGRFAAPPEAMERFVFGLGLPKPEAERIVNRYAARYGSAVR